MVDPGRVIDQFAEYRAALDYVLKIAAVGTAVGMGFDVADPGPVLLFEEVALWADVFPVVVDLSLIHISEPKRLGMI